MMQINEKIEIAGAKVSGKIVVPGASHLCVAAAAGASVAGADGKGVMLSDAAFERPLEVELGTLIEATASGDGLEVAARASADDEASVVATSDCFMESYCKFSISLH